MKTTISIVPVGNIPQAEDVPINDLFNIFRLALQMEQLCTAQKGIGLSAVQVGVPWRLFIVKRNDSYEYFVNCTYTGIGDKEKSIEGCLSLRDEQGNLRRFEVERYPKINVKGKRLKIVNNKLLLDEINREEKGLYSVVFQHELDHDSGRSKMIDIIGKEIEVISTNK